jgi:sec-independent protein translocase protein TatC
MTAQPQQYQPATQERFPGKEMTVLEHLIELKNRLIVCAIAVVIGMVVSLIFAEEIIGWLEEPAKSRVGDFQPVQNRVTEYLEVYFRVGLLGGLILAMPVLVYEILMFVTPGLTPRERKMLFPSLIGIVAFFLMGCAFAYFVVLPPSLKFLLTFGNDVVDDFINIGDYINFVTRLIFFMGVAFETPMILAACAWLGVIRAKQLLGMWRYAFIASVAAAAIITPTPDPVICLTVAGPIFGLYLFGVGLAYLVQPKLPRSALAA